MAGLPAFTGTTFRQFMTAPVATQQYGVEQKHISSPTPSLQHSRLRQAGIREHTDESCDLPKSNDILRHMTESYSNESRNQTGILEYDNFETLEAEVEQLRGDLSKLREESEQGHSTPLVERERAPKEAATSPQRSKLPVPAEQKELSAAARLQKMHEEAERERMEARAPSPQEVPQPPPPSPLDFPTLGSPTASMSSKPNTPTDARRPSYADAAMTGLPKKSAKIAAAPRSSVASQDSADGDTSVIESPTESKTAGVEKAKTAKQSPHFAQATQSYARRAGDTLRKEAGMSPPKATAEPAPTKSIKSKEPNLATEKRSAQRHQKRKSLPGTWMNEAAGSSASSMTDDITKSMVTAPASAKQEVSHPMSPSKIPAPIHTTLVKNETAATKANSKLAQAQQSPRLQKKTSSYMSPTSATTQRTAATLSKERPKRDSPSPKKRAPRLDLSPTKHVAVVRSPEITATGSDTSSVQFILDRPTALVTSPILQAGSPVARYLDEQRAGSSSPFGSPRGSPSRLSRKSRMMEQSSPPPGTVEQQVPSADYQTLYSMPDVGKTTTVRRASNQQILRPILARLSAEGLVRDSPFSLQSPPNSATQNVSSALSAVREASVQSAVELDNRPEILSYGRPTGPSRSEMLLQEIGNLSTRHYGSHLIDGSLAPYETATPTRISPSSSLRATASEFTPMQRPTSSIAPPYGQYHDSQQQQQQQQSLPSYSLDELTKFRSTEEWLCTPVETKMMINQLRTLSYRQRARYHGGPILNRSGPPFGFTAVDENGSPQMLQAGETLRSSTVSGKKNVHWNLEDGNGGEAPVRFGRAPAPPPHFAQDSPHATISPTSDDTSPMKTPRTLPARPWSIGSSVSTMPYGWTGGDGKEIRFVGYGPYAERDPNTAVDFDFHGRKASTSSLALSPRDDRGRRELNKENENEHGNIAAPRSQKQWAQKLGLDRVPCEKVEITQATEHMPFASEVGAYCHDCFAGH